MLVFGYDPDEFPSRRLVIVDGRRARGRGGAARRHRRRARSASQPGDTVDGRGTALPRRGPLPLGQPLRRRRRRPAADNRPGARRAARRGDDVRRHGHARPAADRHGEARRERIPGAVAVTEPGAVVKVDTSSRLIIDAGWIFSVMALIVGGIGVLNTMAMSVIERIQEIGIMRAVGWRKRRIALLILSEATGIGLIALGLGLALGYLAAELFTSQGSISHARRARLHGRRLRLGPRVRARRGADRRALSRRGARSASGRSRRCGGGSGLAVSMRPSRIRSVRSAAAATSSSFVTSTIVIPRSSRSRSSSSTIWAPVVESSAPVGSSASRSFGSFVSARAIATRWRSPPDSVLGERRPAGARSRRPEATRPPSRRARDAAGRGRSSAPGRSRVRSAWG